MPTPGPSGGYTPDPVSKLAARVDSIEARLKALESAPQPASWESDFKAKWAPVSAADFKARYGVDYGKPIPPMGAYDEAEVVFRARSGYLTQGFKYSDGAAAAQNSIAVIAGATAETAPNLWETGFGLCDPDVAAWGFCMKMFPKDGAGPYQYHEFATAEWTALHQVLAANFGGGAPSGG